MRFDVLVHRVPVHCFRVVQPPRTSSNLLEPLQCRERKVCRSLRLYRTFSNLIFTVGTSCVGYLYTIAEWFNPPPPPNHCEDEVREGSVQSNHSELTSQTSTHLAFSALKWFEKVRGGSRGLNHSETVYRYPTHLVTTV